MPEDGSPRPRPMRRLLLAMARAVALLTLVTGIDVALTIALPQTSSLSRHISALIAGVILYELLRPARRRAATTASAEPAAAIPADSLEAQTMIEQLRAEIARAEASIADLSQALEHARASAAEDARSRAAEREESQGRESELRQQYETETEHLQRAGAKALDEIQRGRSASDELRGQLDKERAKANASQQSADALAEVRKKQEAQLEEARQKTETEKNALRRSMEAEWGAKLQKIVSELASDHENDIGEAISARETARAEVRDLTGKLKQVQQELDLTRKSAQQLLHSNEALAQQLEDERRSLHAELQRMISESSQEREEMQAEARSVAARIEDLSSHVERERQISRDLAARRVQLEEENSSLRAQLKQLPVSDEKKLRDSIDVAWSAKLQKIVTELTTDYENEMGDSIASREAARAETRMLNIRVQELEKQLQSARDGRLGLLQRDDELTQRQARLEQENKSLRAQLEAKPAAVDEDALRKKIDGEWSEKLQTIVGHIATDHEADIGKAIEEREAAKAEVRNMSIKMTAVQQKLDAERSSASIAQERFNGMRDELLAQVRELQQEVASLQSLPPPLSLLEPSPFPESEESPEEQERARAEVLEFAEQAHAALTRITPSEEKKARVLFVHHDPALRTMWRDNLGKSGFDVHTAADGLEGLRLTKTEKPDVVIADASMPKMDGRELCQLIKSNQETAGVKVILMTGMYTNEMPVDANSSQFEADELLRKPVKLEAMKNALTSLLAS